MAILDVLLGYGTPFLAAAAVVLFVRRLLRRHKPTEKELRQLELDQQEAVRVMMLPTLTTEGTENIGRDPDYELDALRVRLRGMGW